jgi:hypothetical protein
MIKNITGLQILFNSRIYQLSCDMDAPLSDIKECLFQFQKQIGIFEDQVKAKEEAEKAKEEVKIEPDIKPE